MRRRGRRFGYGFGAALALVLSVGIPAAVAVSPPAAPARPAAVPGNAQARVSWIAPANNGAPITEYVVTPFVGATALTAHVFNSTAVSEVVTGLANGTTYTFAVKAHNASGTGANSVKSAPVVVGTPVAPAKPSATPGNALAHLVWAAPANNGSAITGYVVTPFLGSVAQPARTFNTTAVQDDVTGLTNGATYTFRVAAKNAHGTGVVSVPSGPIVAGAPLAPAAPLVAPGNAQARVNWVAPAANGSAVTGYVVTPMAGTTALAPRTFTSAALVQSVTGLTNGTTYTFRVAARNARGLGPASPATGATTPSGQPTLRAVMNSTIGQPILVDASGMTVYLFVPDGAATTSTVTGPLRTSWPYVTWAGTVTVGPGLTASSATANVQPDNTRLIAYHGHLLYRFVGDHVPGDVTGQALGQFYVLDANGNEIV